MRNESSRFFLAVVLFAGCAPETEVPIVEEPFQAAGLRVVSITGQTWLDGDELFVDVVLAVPTDRDPQEVALETLWFHAPDARPVREEDRWVPTGLVWDTLPVVSNFNGSGAPSSVSGNQRAVWWASQTMWHTSGTSFSFSDGGDTTRCPSLVSECPGSQVFDGNNDFGWVTIKDRNTLGVTWYSTSIDEYDMGLDGPGWNWYSGSEGGIPGNGADMQTIAGHEFGHAVGLSHSDDPSALMYAYYSLGSTQRTLAADDEAGVESIYPGGGGGCTGDAECDDGNACTIDTCDTGTGSCDNTADAGAACDPDGACADGTCDASGACVEDPSCPACRTKGETCSTGADCCSGNCKRGTCRGGGF